MVGAILLAAGSGSRMHGEVADKLLHPIGNSNAFILSCHSFLQVDTIGCLVIVYKDESQLVSLKEFLSPAISAYPHRKSTDILWVQGGAERQDSVWAGIHAFPNEITHILVHDCARPFIQAKTIAQAVTEIIQDRAVCVARRLKDTIRLRVEPINEPLLPTTTRTLDRTNLWLMETPQGAPIAWLREGLERARKDGIVLTDDMAAVECLGHPVGMLEPDYPNPKITTPDDFSYAEFLIHS